MSHPLDARPVIVAIAGPKGAGKSTFFEAFVRPAGLRFIKADVIAKEAGIDAYKAAELAGILRTKLVSEGESFAFETVFSDPAGDKVAFLEAAAGQGYTVVLCFIGLDSANTSDERVAMRVLQGATTFHRRKWSRAFRVRLRTLHGPSPRCLSCGSTTTPISATHSVRSRRSSAAR